MKDSKVYEKAVTCWNDGDYSVAYDIFEMLAANQHPLGTLWLGRFYEEGKNVGKDPAIAIEWYRKAAELGMSRASWMLGNVYGMSPKIRRLLCLFG